MSIQSRVLSTLARAGVEKQLINKYEGKIVSFEKPNLMVVGRLDSLALENSFGEYTVILQIGGRRETIDYSYFEDSIKLIQ